MDDPAAADIPGLGPEQKTGLAWLGLDRGALDRVRLRRHLADHQGFGKRSDEAVSTALSALAARDGLGDLGPTGFSRDAAGTRPAAVLVGLVDRPEGTTVLLTHRTAHLSNHAGQVAFPGGRADDGDADAEGTALREALEETALPPDRVELVGRLDPYVTVTNFRVTPVVGVITPPITLVPDPHEVDRIFEVPLAFILDAANLRREVRMMKGKARRYYAFPYGDHYIWGATAAMLMNLHAVLHGEPLT